MRTVGKVYLLFVISLVSSEYIFLPKNRDDWVKDVNCTNKVDGIYALKCSISYLVCIGRKTTVKTCADGEYFDLARGFCINPLAVYSYGECQFHDIDKHTLYRIPYVEFGNTLEWACYQAKEGMITMEDCAQEYTLCHNWEPIVMRCCKNLYFDDHTQRCIPKEKVRNCDEDIIHQAYYDTTKNIDQQRKALYQH